MRFRTVILPEFRSSPSPLTTKILLEVIFVVTKPQLYLEVVCRGMKKVIESFSIKYLVRKMKK